jgi:hypothetical protein
MRKRAGERIDVVILVLVVILGIFAASYYQSLEFTEFDIRYSPDESGGDDGPGNQCPFPDFPVECCWIECARNRAGGPARCAEEGEERISNCQNTLDFEIAACSEECQGNPFCVVECVGDATDRFTECETNSENQERECVDNIENVFLACMTSCVSGEQPRQLP